jgi:hypothetical protein
MMPIYGLCGTGKVGYLDELDALLSLTHVSALHDGNEKQERNAYRCQTCDFWHLTSQEVCE